MVKIDLLWLQKRRWLNGDDEKGETRCTCRVYVCDRKGIFWKCLDIFCLVRERGEARRATDVTTVSFHAHASPTIHGGTILVDAKEIRVSVRLPFLLP